MFPVAIAKSESLKSDDPELNKIVKFLTFNHPPLKVELTLLSAFHRP